MKLKKILLVEDRPERQEQYIPEGKEGVQKLMNIKGLSCLIGHDCKTHLETLKTNTSILDEFDLLIYHRSALDKLGLTNKVNEYVKNKKKPLIHFTGGENNVIYSTEGFEYLLLSSRIFYSDKLYDFIDKFQLEEQIPLIRFVYGDNWKLSYFLKLRAMLWRDKLEKVPFEERYDEILKKINKTEITAEELEHEIKKATFFI